MLLKLNYYIRLADDDATQDCRKCFEIFLSRVCVVGWNFDEVFDKN